MSLRHRFRQWFSSRRAPIRKTGKTPFQLRKLLPRVEALEDRVVPSVQFSPGPYLVPSVNHTDFAPGDTQDGPIEPLVSINPTNPANITVTSQNGLQVSSNAGAPTGFTSTQIFPFATGYGSNNGDTATAYDSQGRLFWANLETKSGSPRDIVVAQINPTTGAVIGNAVPIPHPAGTGGADKEFIAADSNPNSPYADNLYVSMQYFNSTDDEFEVYVSRSTDHGLTWSTPIKLSVNSGANTEGFTWPSTVTVAPNGDVYVAYHAQPDLVDGDVEGSAGDDDDGPDGGAQGGSSGVGGTGNNNPDGLNGEVIVFRSTDGGVTFSQRTLAFTNGQANITFNKQDAANGNNIAGTKFWTIGSAQPWILADPVHSGFVYVVTSADPSKGGTVSGVTDQADVVFARSGNNGSSWNTSTIESGPDNSFQLFPNASIDSFGDIVVSWYTNASKTANGSGKFLTNKNSSGDYLLNVWAKYSTDGGLTWSSSFQVNDIPIDPDVAVNNRFSGPPVTTRIGEYFGLANYGGTAYVAWRDSSRDGSNNPIGPSRVLEDAFSINGSLTVSGDDGGGPVNDHFVLEQIANNPGFIEITDNGTVVYAGLLAGVAGGIQFNGLNGNDTLTVDFSNGNPIPTGGVDFDGGDGINSMTLTGGAETSETYSVGPSVGSGTFQITAGANTGSASAGTIHFEHLSPVLDNVPGSSTTVNATNGDNAINYAQGPGGGIFTGNTGLVSVDNQESYEFNNKTNLVINGLAGSDTINLNNATTPAGLTGSITINGGDPTASDTVIVNGTSGADIVTIDQLTLAGARITGLGPTISVATTEHLTYNGQGGDDSLTVTTPAGGQVVTLTPGAVPGEGTISARDFTGAGGNPLLPIAFTGISANGSLSLADAGGTRSDYLIVNGTAASDVFDVTTTGLVTLSAQAAGGTTRLALIPVSTPGAAFLELEGLDGDDTFNIPGNHPFGNGVLVNGGDPSASDVLNFTGNGAGAVTVNLNAQTITEAGFTSVSFSGVEVVNVNAAGAAVTVTDSTAADSLTVTPTASNAATLTDSSLNTTFNFSSVSTAANGFAVSATGSSDQLSVEGTQSADTIDVNDAASGANAVKVNSLLVVNYNSSLAHVEVDALAGSDTINVAPSTTTTFLVDGGDPIGVLPGDTINLLHPPGPFQVFAGPTKDSGGLATPGFQTVSWSHIETVVNTGGGAPLITATNGNDEITVIARDSSYNPALPGVPNPLLDGVQDFTVSINDGPDMLFINTPNLFIDSLSGNDDIVVREPAPNQAVWNVQVFVAAGPPAAGSNGLGDNIELETPGTQSVTYTPNNALSSVPAVPGVVFSTPSAGGGQFNDTTNTSTINAVQFLMPLFYQSSPGGAENFVYAGESGNDTLTYNTPANANAGSNLIYTPGATADAGGITGALSGGAALTPLIFSGLGTTGTVSFTTSNTGRTDHLNVEGVPTAAGQSFAVTPANGGTVQVSQLAPGSSIITVPILTASVNTLELDGLGGNDTFNLTGALPYTNGLIVDDGATVNLSAASGPVTVFVGNNTPGSPNPNTVITGYGAPVTLIGVDTANLDANGQTMTATGTTQNDNTVYTPTGAMAGTFYDDIGSGNNLVPNTVFNIANVSGNFMVFNDPGGNADQVSIRGTAARDLIEINQGSGIAQVLANNVTALLPVQLGISAEILNALGLGGQDTFQVIPAPGIAGQAQDNLLVNVDGGSGGEKNALVIGGSFGATPATLGANVFVVDNRDSLSSGTVRVYTSAVANPDINYTNIQTVSPTVFQNTANPPGLNPNLLVMGPDTNEPNETEGNAAFLGSGSTLQVQNAAIFPNSSEFIGASADTDYYRVVAQTTGTLDFQVYFRTFSTALLPGGGQLNLQAFDVNGNLIASAPGVFGADPGTGNARIRIPAVAGQSYFLRVLGSTATVVNGYNMTILDTAPPTPHDLELSRSVAAGIAGSPDTGDLPTNAANNDSGRSQFDDVTNVNKPTIYIRLDDGIFLNDLPGNGVPDSPPAGVIPIPFSPNSTTPGYRVAIFDGNNTQTPVGFATPVGAGFPGLYQFTFATALADGVHHLTAAVQMVDPANPAQTGFGGRSTALNLTVDTAPPPVQFGGPGFNGLVTDTGVPVEPETAQDLVTSDTTPTFAGLAEANSIIRVFAAITNPNNPNFSPNPVFPNNYVQLGLTVAIPLDGTNAFPNGQWTLTSLVDLNNPDFFDPADGERNLIVTAEDLAGNIGSPVGKPLQNLSIFLDTSGPRIEGVNISNPITGVENTNFNLFGLKPDNQNQGPTPLVYSITIDVVDNPPRTLAHLENAIKKPVAEAPGGILVIGDQVGEVAIAQIIATNNPPVPGQPATATVQLIFTAPLPDDRYTLHIFDTSIVDPAGNLLDGESNAQEPIGIPTFPSGNGINGGDFFARFTVNTRPNIGVDGNGIQQLDVNGNGFYDPVNAHDATNSDKSFAFARYSDNLFAGNFAPAGQDGNGFQRLGAYGVANGKFRFILSFAGIADTQKTIVPTLQINGLPVAYKFNPNVNADEIAVFDGKGNWYIDFNHTNNLTSKSLVISDGLRGYPVAGDFDGNGSFDLATYQPDTNTWQFDLNPLGPNHAFRTLTWGFAGVMERPVAADMNADGITDIGLFVPTSMSPIATPASNWYFLESTPGPADPVVAQAILGGVPTGLALGIQGTINALNHPFSDTPFSQDQHFFFGDGFSQPIVGLWDPPLPAAAQLPVLKTVGTFSDVAVQAEIDKIASGGMAGLVSRRAANGQTQYWGGVTRTGNTYTAQIQKLVGGKVQTLASRTVTLPARSILRLETVGTTLKLYLNKSLVLTVADASIRGTGTAGTWSSPLSVVWTPTATTLTRTPTTLPYSNAPKLPTGTLLDSSWDQWSGSFVGTGSGIGGQAKSNLATLFGLSQKNVSVQADISALAAGNFAGLVLRYNAATGDMVYGQVVNTKGTYYAEIWRVSHGVATRLTHVSLGKTAPHHLRFDAVGTLYTLSVDSHLAGQISDWTSYQGGTVGLQGGAGSRFANFSAQAI